MHRIIFTLAFMVLALLNAQSQSVGIGTQNPHASALMDISSSTKGILVPRMTTLQRTSIANPANGLLVYDTQLLQFYYYNGTSWVSIGNGGGGSGSPFTFSNGNIHNTGNALQANFILGRENLPLPGEFIEDRFLFFDKTKGALRAGSVTNDLAYWEPANVGVASIGLGQNNIASAQGAIALGTNNNATGVESVAIGSFNHSGKLWSVTLGTSNKADDDGAFAAGVLSEALGSVSQAIGRTAKAKGDFSTAIGFNTQANAFSSISLGRFNDTLTGTSATTWVATDPLLVVGNGTANNSRRNALTLLKNGYMGLGTVAPKSMMHISSDGVQSAGQLMVEESGDAGDGSRITFKNKASNGYWDLYGNAAGGVSSEARFNIHFGGIRDVMTLTGTGFVSIGAPTPTAALDVLSTSNPGWPQLAARGKTNDFVRFRMSNTANPIPYWDIASQTSGITPGNARMNFYYYHAAGVASDILSLHGNGNAILAGALTQNSDARLKTNITPIGNALPLLLQLNGYHYNWKDTWRDKQLQTGLLAQEIEKVMPELVTTDGEGMKSVQYTGMIPYLLEAIKTLHEQNQQLQSRLEKLEKK